jgi:hypothetical protein
MRGVGVVQVPSEDVDEKIKAALEGAVVEYRGSLEEATRNMDKLLESRLGDVCGEVRVLINLVDYDRGFIAVSAYCEKAGRYVGFSARVRRVELELYDVRVR